MPVLLTITLEDITAAEILTGYSAGALVRLQRDTTSAFSTATNLTTIAVVSGTESYTYWDSTGTTSSWYRTRYENSGGTLLSSWSDGFQPTGHGTATGSYATRAGVKARYGFTDAVDDPFIDILCNQVNGFIENRVGRAIAPLAGTGPWLFDGRDALENGRLLIVEQGIRSITTLRVQPHTGGDWSSIPSTDYFILPPVQKRQPGWPGFELWMTDIPTSGNPYPYFPVGIANVELTGLLGWAVIPDELRDVAETLVVRMYQARKTGQSDVVGTDELGNPMISRLLSGRDLYTLKGYAFNVPLII